MTNRLTAILLVIGLTGALAYTGNFDVGYGRYGPGIYGGISAYGGAYPGGQYPGLTDQVAVTGYARFIGPLSADCVASVNGILIGQNKTLTADGKIAVNGSLPVDVFPGCVDTFTGLRTPFFVYAESAAATGTDNKTFIISPVTKINEWADQGTSTNTAASAYARLGVVPPTGISADTNTISLLAAGGASTEVGVAMLAADVAYSNYLLVGAKWLYAVSKATNASRACGTIDDFVDALGYHVAAVTNATTTFNTSNADALTAALKGAANVCVFNLNQTSANLTDYTPIAANVAATIAGLNSAVAGAAKEASADTLIASVFYLIKLSGAVQAELGFAANVTASWAAADSTAALAKLESAVDSFAPNYATILTAIGATGAPTTLFATKAVTVKVFGNVDKAKTAAADVLKLTQQTGTTSNGSVSLASSGTAVFSAANGGNDTLTQAAVKVGLAAILPFATTTTVTPMSPLIYFTWAGLNVADGPTLVEAKHIAAVYQGFTGVTNTTGFTIDTFTTQGFSQGSAAQLLFLAADQLVYSLPLLGATFVAGAKTGADIDNEALALYQALYNKALATLKTNLITNDDVVSLIKARFNGDLSTDGSNVPFGSSRKLLQTATIDTVLAAMASAITESNTRMNNILAAAAASQNTGSTLDKTAFLTLAKIAKLQATEIAAAIANIAASVRSGDLTTALSLANKASSDFSGANLDSAIARQSVNEAGLADLANTDLDTLTGGGSSSDDKKKKIALGVGLGVGLGVPFLIALIALVVIFAKKRRGSQATAPAAVSESWINTNNRVAPETAEAEESMIASYYQRRLMNQ